MPLRARRRDEGREGGREGYVQVVRNRGGCYVPLRARRREGERKGGRCM